MNPHADSRRAIVIGSGFGGLAIANRLLSAGMEVTLMEKRERVGGRAYQFREAGYTFDMGPSLITAPEIISDIFQQAGQRLEDYLRLVPLDPYYRVYFHDGTHIDYTGDPDHMKAQMRQFNERDAARYDDFMDATRSIYNAVITDRLGARPFDTLKSMVDFMPRAIRMGALLPVSMYARRFFKDPRHHFLFSFHPLFIGGNPFRSPSVYIMIPYLEREQGVWFTHGGMYSLVEALESLYTSRGGRLITSSEVTEITVNDGVASGVVANRRHYRADIVVSNADVAFTYRNLVPEAHRKRWTNRRVDNLKQTMSCFLLYLGVRRQYPKLEHHTLILSKRYKALLRDIFDRKILPDDFSMYLHAPTRTDRSMAPDGCESLYVLVPVANLRSGIDWGKQARPFADRVIDFLQNWGLDDLRRHIEVERIFTPNDFERELNATDGNAFGIEPRLSQTAYFRPHNRSEDIPNLYLVGAGTHPGAGVPGVLLSAEATEYSIRRDAPERDGVASVPSLS